jgi:hypothetical protein
MEKCSDKRTYHAYHAYHAPFCHFASTVPAERPQQYPSEGAFRASFLGLIDWVVQVSAPLDKCHKLQRHDF